MYLENETTIFVCLICMSKCHFIVILLFCKGQNVESISFDIHFPIYPVSTSFCVLCIQQYDEYCRTANQFCGQRQLSPNIVNIAFMISSFTMFMFHLVSKPNTQTNSISPYICRVSRFSEYKS